MAFNFGNMMKTAGHNFMQSMKGDGAPVMNSAGEDISAAFGPQGPAPTPGWGQMSNHDRLATLGDIFGGGTSGGRETPPPAASAPQDALSALMAHMGQGAAPAALPEPAMRPRGGGAVSDVDLSAIRRRFGFGR